MRFWKSGRQHGAAAAAEHEPESAEEFSGEFGVFFNSFLSTIALFDAMMPERKVRAGDDRAGLVRLNCQRLCEGSKLRQGSSPNRQRLGEQGVNQGSRTPPLQREVRQSVLKPARSPST